MVSPVRLGGEEPGDIESDVPPPPPSPGAIIKPRNVVTPPTFRGGDFSNGLIDNDDDDITIDVDKTTGEVVISHTEEIVKTPGTYDEDGEELTPPVLEYVVRSATFTPLDIIPSSYAETPSREVKSGKIVRRKRLLRNENDEIKVRVEKTGQYDWIPEEEFDEVLHERIYEEFDVELKKIEPSKAVMTTGKKSVTIIAVKNFLKETISLDTYSKRSIRWNVVLDKMVLKKHGEIIQAYKENGKDKLPFKLPPPTASNDVEVHWYWGASTGDLRIAFDTLAADIKFPLTIDPSFTFDGSDFVIASAQTEVKTYQNTDSWHIYGDRGTNIRHLNGYLTADTTGLNTAVWLVTPGFPEPIDIDFASWDVSIDVKTTNADALWTFGLWLQSAGGGYYYYRKTGIVGDVDVTYTLADLSASSNDNFDPSAVTALMIVTQDIDTALAGNVTVQYKDLKFTTRVKTSDMYDDTGRFVLYDEDFEGDDGLSVDEYDPAAAVVVTGASVIEIDDAQAPGGGSTSVLLHRVGADTCYFRSPVEMSTDYTRYVYHARMAQTNVTCIHVLRETNVVKCYTFFNNGGNAGVYYGDGIGGNNTVVAFAYSADTDYEVWYDVDFTNNTYRVWFDGVMYPGPNADAQGFDNMNSDETAIAIDQYISQIVANVGMWWFDGLKIYAGFEDFSALTTPHDIDDFCEAVSPSGTDYGRGTWDGDWTQSGGGGIGVDNTSVVIGTNSIKGTATGAGDQIQYTFDSTVTTDDKTGIRFYFNSANGGAFRFYILFDGGGSYYIDEPSIPAGWTYLEYDISSMSHSLGDTTVAYGIRTRNNAGNGVQDVWIDGLHFYGDTDAGLCMKGNSLDVDGNVFMHDNDIYDLKTIKDTTTGGSFISTANIEFSDVALAGYDDNGLAVLTITGTDENNHVLWNAVGDANPTNEWTAQKSIVTLATLTHVTYKYATMPIFVNNVTLYDVFFDTNKTCPQIQGSTNMGTHYKVKVRNNGHASASLYIEQAQIFVEADIDGTKAKNVWMNTGQVTIFINSKFDRDYLEVHADGMVVSKNHNKTSEYLVASGTNGRGVSDISEPYKPNQTFDVDVVAGPFDFDSDLDMVRDLRIRSGVTIDNSSGKLLILGVLTNEGTRNDTADDTYLMNYELPLPVSEQIAYELNGKWKI